jgi:crotonobetainyl-CoA:carnitine CoA-transferase CaiB-like acyl-CoA transferase
VTEVLRGVRVIELGTMITAPLAGMMLADFGADVIKVERPDGGDPFRSFRGGLYSPQFIAFNRNKRSVVLDLQTDAGRASLRTLLSEADVLIENYRPAVMDRLGLRADDIQAEFPRLIWCSITGFGPGGPYADRPAYDAVAGALSGVASITLDREKPAASGPTISDNVTGMYAAYGILAALFEREKTGRGRRVEVNMLEAAVAFIPDSFVNYTRLQVDNHPRTRVATSQSYAFRCADDKLLALHLSSSQKFWENLLQAIERPDLKDDPRFGPRDARVQNYVALEAELAAVFVRRDRLYWITRLERADVPFAPVQTVPDVLSDPQIRHLKTFYEQTHTSEGPLTLVNRPVWIDGSRDVKRRPPPTLGEHTSEVLGECAARKGNKKKAVEPG